MHQKILFIDRLTDHLKRAGWQVLVAVFLLSGALLDCGCANDAFIPPPENLPPGQRGYEEAPAQHLQPPADL